MTRIMLVATREKFSDQKYNFWWLEGGGGILRSLYFQERRLMKWYKFGNRWNEGQKRSLRRISWNWEETSSILRYVSNYLKLDSKHLLVAAGSKHDKWSHSRGNTKAESASGFITANTTNWSALQNPCRPPIFSASVCLNGCSVQAFG
jgi:hypothetical protein